MIQIEDNDLPIMAAEKIICGTKPVSELQSAMRKALIGKGINGQDMFELEEIKEIADYLYVYYQSNKPED